MKTLILRHGWYMAAAAFIFTAALRGAETTLETSNPPGHLLAADSETTGAGRQNQTTIMRARKPWTFLAYIAANNNLHTFALQNLREMTRVGSNDNINVIVQFDGVGEGTIKRYYIERGNARLLNELPADVNSISGTPQSLYQFIKWGYQAFPAEHVAIDLWNHGSGIKDPSIWGRFVMRHRDDLFQFNPSSHMLELNRRLAADHADTETAVDENNTLFRDFALGVLKQRGIAFNDSEEVYIDNQQLRRVLDNVCRYVLVDKKIDIVFMDACHMGMVELASKLRPYADYMVASSEVEPGRGYNYERLLTPFTSAALTARAFAIHGVRSYEQEYKFSHSDYTQAAVDLSSFNAVETTFTNVGKALTDSLTNAESRRVFDLLKVTRLSSKYTTEFYDPDYIDAGHFLISLTMKGREILSSHDTTLGRTQRAALDAIAHECELGYGALTTSIIAETHGSNLAMAHGLGIFFPKRSIHSSYFTTTFDKKTGWSKFLDCFLTRLKYGRDIEEGSQQKPTLPPTNQTN